MVELLLSCEQNFDYAFFVGPDVFVLVDEIFLFGVSVATLFVVSADGSYVVV